MIGTLDPKQREVTIVGAGIAGLIAADRLDRAGYQVTLIEASPRVGGLIRTRKTAFGIAEAAAHSLLLTPAAEAYFKDLGVEVVRLKKDSRARYIVRGGVPSRFPLKVHEALGALFRAYFMRAARDVSPRQNLSEWSQRHLGRAALDYLINPFLRGIYAARPQDITIGAAFPGLYVPPGHSLASAWLAKRWTKSLPTQLPGRPETPIMSGRGEMCAPRYGMQGVVDALESRLRERLGSRLRLGESVVRIPDSRNVILATPAHAAARLLGTVDAQAARVLAQVPYTALVTATVFLRSEQLRKEPAGVGVLVPEREDRKVLGVLFNSSSFEGRVKDPDAFVSVTAMLGEKWVGASDDEIRRVIREELASLVSLEGDPQHIEVTRWEEAIPVYGTRLQDAWRVLAQGWCSTPGRMVFGNYTGQVSLRGMIETALQRL